MNDFKEFLDKVLAPIRGETQAEPPPCAMPTLLFSQFVDPEEQDPRDVLPTEELQRRYIAVMNALLADAARRCALGVFTDVVAQKLAEVAFHFGTRGTGDIVRRLGAHLESIGAAEEARREAEQGQYEADEAKKKGRRPN